MLEAFRLAVSILGNDYLPVAVQDDVLLFAIDGKEIFQDNSSERWAQYLTHPIAHRLALPNTFIMSNSCTISL